MITLSTCCDVIAKCIQREECFFQLPWANLSRGLNTKLVFKNNFVNNSADNAGIVCSLKYAQNGSKRNRIR